MFMFKMSMYNQDKDSALFHELAWFYNGSRSLDLLDIREIKLIVPKNYDVRM